jgi:phosphoribosyl 1,2-cyclic phosphate phosphodiesterase
MCIAEAIETARDIGAPQSFLTHLTHAVPHAATEAQLPDTVRLAYDGLRLSL